VAGAELHSPATPGGILAFYRALGGADVKRAVTGLSPSWKLRKGRTEKVDFDPAGVFT